MLNLILIYFSMNFHFLSANLFQNFNDISAEKEFRSLALCIREVSKRELFWSPTLVLEVGENQTNSKSAITNEILEVFKQENSPYISAESLKQIFDVNQASYLVVVHFDNSNALLNFNFDTIQKKIKYLLVLDYSENFSGSDFQSIGYRAGKYDVTFFIKASDAEYKMETFIPIIDRKSCKETVQSPVEINACVNGYLRRNVTFPSKHPTDLKGCPFKVGLSALFPFTIIENKESLSNMDSLEDVSIQGMDLEILKIIAKYINAALELYYIYIHDENPYVNSEFLPYLLNGSLDACAGGMYRIYGDVVEYSGIYTMQSVTWLYTADRLPKTWQNLIANTNGLYLFMVCYIAYSFVWYIVCLFDKNAVSLTNTLLYSWGALVGATSLADARSLKQKALNFIYLLMCLHLSVYISIQLYSYLTISGLPEIIRTNQDIMSSGRKLYLNPLAKYFVIDQNYLRFANTSLNCESYSDCAAKSLQNKGVTLMTESHFIRLQARTVVGDEARILRPLENILVVYNEMIIHKHYASVSKFQGIIERLFEAGITTQLFKSAIGLNKFSFVKNAARNMMSSSYSCQEGCTINFDQISGAFYLWAIGCGLAFAIFVIELLFKKDKNIYVRSNRTSLKVDKIPIVNKYKLRKLPKQHK